jgi:hypothetical protein
MKKITVLFFSLLLLSTTLIARYSISHEDRGVVGRIKSHQIEGRINPINVYEVCLDGIVYFLIVDGYKAGMTAKIRLFPDGNTTYAKCKRINGRWEETK